MDLEIEPESLWEDTQYEEYRVEVLEIFNEGRLVKCRAFKPKYGKCFGGIETHHLVDFLKRFKKVYMVEGFEI